MTVVRKFRPTNNLIRGMQRSLLRRKPPPLPKAPPKPKKLTPTWGLQIEKHHLEGDTVEPVTLSCQAYTKGEARAAFKDMLRGLGPAVSLPAGLTVFRLPDPEPVVKPFNKNDITTYPPALLDEAKALSELVEHLQPSDFVEGVSP